MDVPAYPTLEDWLAGHVGGGHWIVCVFDCPDRAHVLVAYGSTVVAGGPIEEYGGWRVYFVLRVFPPTGV